MTTGAGWGRALTWSAAATLASLALTFWVRVAFQVRTLPERMMEWLLLYLPPEQFERALQRFGPQAKVLVLAAGVAVMGAILLGLGVLPLRRGWRGEAVLGLAVLLYLVAAGGLLPLTGAGFFGAELLQHPLLVNAAYLGAALAYGTVLLAGQALQEVRGLTSDVRRGAVPSDLGPRTSDWAGRSGAGPPPGTRRALLLGAAGTVAACAVVLRQGALGGTSGSDLPLAELPTPGAPGAPGAPAPAITPNPTR